MSANGARKSDLFRVIAERDATIVQLRDDIAEFRTKITDLTRACCVIVEALQSPMGDYAVRDAMKYLVDAAPHIFEQRGATNG